MVSGFRVLPELGCDQLSAPDALVADSGLDDQLDDVHAEEEAVTVHGRYPIR